MSFSTLAIPAHCSCERIDAPSKHSAFISAFGFTHRTNFSSRTVSWDLNLAATLVDCSLLPVVFFGSVDSNSERSRAHLE
ncbi:hypothetical protein WR25_15277 [Diploscapter pachys]|uniref:Uncharacterized protein n=1 Tax=Diploscapter pachys TaxID=2018661 RepID=A0A2A2KFU1_9BILA|nr:hypothetical protein WR25_15277 [Diploscapter pachys]